MWPYLLSVVIGLWLMGSPGLFDYPNPARACFYIVGPLVTTFAIMAFWEITRGVRWLNVALGLWMIMAPWVLSFPSDIGINSFVSGVLLASLSLMRGTRVHPFGGGWSSLWKTDASGAAKAST